MRVKKKTKTPEADSFESVARRLGCNEDKEHFEKALSKIAHAKPKKTKPAKRRERL
jgi:hypothetical protein